MEEEGGGVRMVRNREAKCGVRKKKVRERAYLEEAVRGRRKIWPWAGRHSSC